MELVYKNERPLFVTSMVIGALVWLALVVATFGVGLVYVALFFVIYLFAQSGFISYLRGNTVELSEQQFPDLYAQYQETCQKFGMTQVPTAYLMMSNGVLNALATRFLRQHYVVLFSNVVEALRSRPEALRFYFGHELAHITQGHLKMQWLRWPASVLPLLGAAYRRAQEYTCDLHGLAASNSLDDALSALGVLGSGGDRLSQLNARAFIDQQAQSGGFWMSYHELTNDYPWLCKRLAHISAVSDRGPRGYQAPRRNVGAVLLASVTPRFGVGGGGASALILVAMIGIMAAIAIPAYHDYTLRAEVAGVWPVVEEIQTAAHKYVDENRAYPESPSDVGLPDTLESGPVKRIRVIDEGFELTLRSDNEQLNDATVVVAAFATDDGGISWSCIDGSLPAKYRPPHCRSGSP